MSDICTDNRFELIAKYKAKLIEATNIETSADEMAVIDNILFRVWQMGWLDRLEQPTVDAVPVVRKPIRGYEGIYEVDNLARVFSVERIKTVNDNGRIYDKPISAKQLRQGMHSKGYKVVTLTKDGISKTHFVHRLVAEAFIENPSGLPMINHKDEDKTNNLPENLEWCDAKYNATYGNAIRKRVRKIIGIKHTDKHNAKISESLKKHCETHESKSIGRESEKQKKVIAVDESGQEFVFSNSYEAAEKTGVDRRNIFACCQGKKKRMKGYKFDWFCADGERRTDGNTAENE